MPKNVVTSRDLRDTLEGNRGRAGMPLGVMIEGGTKALLIPVADGDLNTAREAWARGRALLALGRLQAQAVRQGTSKLTRADIGMEVRTARNARDKRARRANP